MLSDTLRLMYDTFTSARWYEENYYDDGGNSLPVDFSFDEWDMMQLPCCWNTVDRLYHHYEGSMVFTRRFMYEKRNDDERVILKISAANYLCRLYMNKKYVGMHKGGSTPCYFDITGYLEKNNRIIIQVDNTRRDEQVPPAVTDWFNYGGIYRDIELIRVPKLHLEDFQIALEPGSGFSKIRVGVEMSEKVDAVAHLKIEGLQRSEYDIEIRNGHGGLVFDALPKLWTSENPVLYDVSLSCAGDMVQDRVGFREIRVEGMDILLNGEKCFYVE